MNIKPFTGPGSTPARRKFWNDALNAVLSARKLAGQHTTVDEHFGAGTIINYVQEPGHRGGTGACCYNDGTCDDLTETDCTDAGGNWQGSGTTCADTSCLGACCYPDGSCADNVTQETCITGGGAFQDFQSTCADVDCTHTGACCFGTTCNILTSSACATTGGVYEGDGTLCDPNPCLGGMGACCNHDDASCTITTAADCIGTYGGDGSTCDMFICTGGGGTGCCQTGGFHDSLGHYLTKVVTYEYNDNMGDPFDHCIASWMHVYTYQIDPVTCAVSLLCSGGGTRTFESHPGDNQTWTWEYNSALGMCVGVGSPGSPSPCDVSGANTCAALTPDDPPQTCHYDSGTGFTSDATLSVSFSDSCL